MQRQRIAITATFTADPLEAPLAFWAHELGLPWRVEFAPYNQVFQQLLDPASLLSRNAQGINVVLVRFEDWQRHDSAASNGAQAQIQRSLDDLVNALLAATERSAVPYLVCVCPASPGLMADPDWAVFHREMQESVTKRLLDRRGLYLITPEQLAVTYPVESYHDPDSEELGQVPYTPAFFASLGTLLARRIYVLQTPPRKVVVVDCDETLWQGICGEVGPHGVELDPPHRALQEFLVAQHDAGMLLCLCSKNHEEDVWDVFRCRPEMPLRREHLVAWRLNWQLKSVNLKSLAAELQLGLDSFIFIDDNPLECAEVEANCPGVITLPLPQPAARIPRFLQNLWAFDHLSISAEDRKRTLLYQQNAQRERLRSEAPTLADFLAGLELQVRIEEPPRQSLARVAQLTQRTNQFNCTAIRRSEAEIKQLCQTGELHCLAAEVSDRFGEYGLVGAMLYRPNGEAVHVDTFLLSCRVLGRGVEHRMLRRLGEITVERGLSFVEVPFVPTLKNQPAQDFLEAVGASFREHRDASFIFRFPADVVAELTYGPESMARSGEPAEVASPRTDPAEASAPSRLHYRIATKVQSAEDVVQAIGDWRRRSRTRSEAGANSGTAFLAPRTPVEVSLAAIWGEVLGIEGIGLEDNFFHLGGDSLLATQVVSRVRQAFQVPLPLRTLFESPTVAGLAVAVLEHLADGADDLEMETLLDELESVAAEAPPAQ